MSARFPFPEDSVRGLTVQQPWADAIIHCGKDVENRSWRVRRTDVPLLIHAASRARFALSPRADLPGVRSAVLGVGYLRACHPGVGCACSPWAESDALWHWELTDVCPLSEPLPTAGGRGLWRPSETLLGRVMAHLPTHGWRRPAGLDEALEGAA